MARGALLGHGRFVLRTLGGVGRCSSGGLVCLALGFGGLRGSPLGLERLHARLQRGDPRIQRIRGRFDLELVLGRRRRLRPRGAR